MIFIIKKMKEEYTKKELMNNQNFKSSIIEEQEKKGGTKVFVEMISKLNTSRLQTHIFHWQVTKTGSFAAHLALEGYYKEIPKLIDKIVESYQGKYGIIKNYTCDGVSDFKSIEDTIKYFEDLVSMVETNRKSNKDSYIQNQIDGVVELIQQTLYKLKYLS
jgi:DNA-binding ferritin-like protein